MATIQVKRGVATVQAWTVRRVKLASSQFPWCPSSTVRETEKLHLPPPGVKTEDGAGLLRGKKGIGCLGLDISHMRVAQDD